ncbi:N-(5'-phosphoribosyl)anthranilate isomerase [Halorientalis sp. IM1011]|uniref:phosphoribosylanthranilate isomerase n=1 Tax=Halorientalis sp. IM1011 TaxID=1932360 RepID=UPI00097CC5B3|nr:phosphoribosylanthranilate isomerase [Halorientalis sp. IM1011]AQL43719.1 N-(5'-phosphoribosyl)anthranilate isomerase [Halorientalis sp. IM1011]
MTRAKICGITRESDLDAVVAAGADAVGVTAAVTVDTPREVSVEQAADFAAAVPPFVTSVLVTMPDTVARAVQLVERVEPDAVQLHGNLGPDEIAAVGDRVPVKTIAAVDVTDPAVGDYADAADALLVDSVDEQGGGGTGETHDWERTAELVAELNAPVILAGGLTPENVAEAVDTVEPFAVDVASGVERQGGVKDHDAVRRFVERTGSAVVDA